MTTPTTPTTSTKKPSTTKATAPKASLPELSSQQIALLTERELVKLATHLGRLKEKRKKALAQQRAAEAALREVHRQIRLLLQGAALDAKGRDQGGDAAVGELTAAEAEATRP